MLLRDPTQRPVSLRLIKSWYSPIFSARSKSSRCFSLIHSDLGISHSAETGPDPAPFTRSAGSLVAAIASACLAERTSIQIMAGRSGRPSRSRVTTEQQVVSTQSAITSWGVTFALASAPLTEAPSACHQSSGSCSDQDGLGKSVLYAVA